jgi:hypothetical protein
LIQLTIKIQGKNIEDERQIARMIEFMADPRGIRDWKTEITKEEFPDEEC